MSATGGGPGTNGFKVRGVGKSAAVISRSETSIDLRLSSGLETAVADISLALTAPGVATWKAISELAGVVGNDRWSVVGGQMVAILAAAHGMAPPRVTTDGDIVVDVRTFGRESMGDVAETLRDVGFEMEVSPEGISRFVRGSAKIDLLAPDGMGDAPVFTSPPGRSVQAPGTTQALGRSGLVTVRYGEGEVQVRCPSLLGAVVAKAAATTIFSTVAERLKHQRDLVFLLLVASRSDLAGMRAEMTKSDRKRLSAAVGPLLASTDHPAWSTADEPSDSMSAAKFLLGA